MGGNPAMAVEYRQEHCQTVLIQAQGHPARIGQMAVVNQGLDFHQHRSGTFPGSHDHAAGHLFLGTRQKDCRRVGDFLQAAVGHAEHAQFVDRTKAVLYRSQQTQAAIGLALEIQDSIDHVLKHPWPRQRAFLGDMTDEEDRRPTLLGIAHQQGRTFAHLGYAAGCRLQLLSEDGLD
ncbi:hypothetical protein D3C72_1231270 [compost metagenome]